MAKEGNPLDEKHNSENAHLPGRPKKHDKNTSKEKEKPNNPDKDLEIIEKALLEIEKYENKIQEAGIEGIDNTKHPEIAQKHQSILNQLEKKSVAFLKMMSEKLSAYPKEWVESFRDKHIDKKCYHLRVLINDNKTPKEVRILERKSKEEKVAWEKEKAERSFDVAFKEAQSILVTLESGQWGNSKNNNDAFSEANLFLYEFVREATELGRKDDALRILKVYEKNTRLMDADHCYSFRDSLVNISRFIDARIGQDILFENEDGFSDSRIEEECGSDPFVICGFLQENHSQKARRIPLLQKNVDMILEQHPKGGRFSQDICNSFEEVLELNPEKYAVDPVARRAMFGTLSKDKEMRIMSRQLHVFQPNLAEYAPEKVSEIIQNYSSYDFSRPQAQLVVASLPLTEENFKQIQTKIQKDFGYKKDPDDNRAPYSKEILLKGFYEMENNEGLHVPFFHYEKFDLDVETRLNIFHRLVGSSHNSNNLQLLGSMLFHFKHIFSEIREEEIEGGMNTLIEKVLGNESIEKTHMMSVLLPEYDISERLKEKINETISKSHMSDDRLIRKLFGNDQDKEKSEHEKWLLGQGRITREMELAFYERGNQTDLRHFFFDVIDGKREAVDRDLLTKGYARSMHSISNDEFFELFLLQKKIPEQYMPIFLEKIESDYNFLNQLKVKLEQGQITKEQYKSVLCSAVEGGSLMLSSDSIVASMEEGLVDDSELQILSKKFAENVSARALKNFVIDKEIFNRILYRHGVAEKNKELIIRDFFNEFLEHEKLHYEIINTVENYKEIFYAGYRSDADKKVFVSQLIDSKSPDAVQALMRSYLGQVSGERNPTTLSELLTQEDMVKLFRNGMQMDNLSIDTVSFQYFRNLTEDQRKSLLEKTLAKDNIFDTANGDGHKMNDFFYMIVNLASTEEDDRNITEAEIEQIFSKIFASKSVSGDVLSRFSYKSFLLENKKILKEYANAVCERGNSYACDKLLSEYQSVNNPVLSRDQVKLLSTRILKNTPLTGDIYRRYLESTEKTQIFYLDQELIDENISQIFDLKKGLQFDIGPAIDLLQEQRNAKGNDAYKGKIFLSSEQEEQIGKKIISQDMLISSQFEKMYDVDSELFKKSFSWALANKKINRSPLSSVLSAKEEVLNGFSSEIIKYSLSEDMVSARSLSDLCARYSQDPASIKEIKENIENVSSIETRASLKAVLLQKDLFEVEELRSFYDEMRTQDNVRSQVLLSAELLGTLASAEQPEKIKAFFANENETVNRKIEEISNFVKKYSLENKGRTIAVMLFAKEYLPERSAEEVIEKVADELAKHERVLNRFQYEGIPPGLRASIGLEYEITNSTAQGYNELTGRELKTDIVRLSNAARLGSGRDAVHEIATRPATNPYLLLLEMQILSDIEYVDLNFDRSPLYQKGARGYHLTIGGEKGLEVNANTHFLQNVILAASWGGIHAGETGQRVSGGRGVTLRGRGQDSQNNIKIFSEKTPSVELRSLSVDKMEPFQRAIITAYHGAIAIQAFEKYTNASSYLAAQNPKSTREDLFVGGEEVERDAKSEKIIFAWIDLLSEIEDATRYHNENFLSGEAGGYLDKNNEWVGLEEFGGEYNRNRFDAVVESIDPTLSVEEYVKSTEIKFDDLFSSFKVELADAFTKINNLYLKPGNKGGDQANALSMLQITKLGNNVVERRDEPVYLEGTIFDTLGERREGYYNVQGASERMFTHAVQIALLKFNKTMEEILN